MIKNKNHKKRRSFFSTIIAHLTVFVQKHAIFHNFLIFFLFNQQFIGRNLATQIIIITQVFKLGGARL